MTTSAAESAFQNDIIRELIETGWSWATLLARIASGLRQHHHQQGE